MEDRESAWKTSKSSELGVILHGVFMAVLLSTAVYFREITVENTALFIQSNTPGTPAASTVQNNPQTISFTPKATNTNGFILGISRRRGW